MNLLVQRCSVPAIARWCWEFRQAGYYNAGFAQTRITAHLSALSARLDYLVRRFLALKLRSLFLKTSRGVLSNQEMLFPF